MADLRPEVRSWLREKMTGRVWVFVRIEKIEVWFEQPRDMVMFRFHWW